MGVGGQCGDRGGKTIEGERVATPREGKAAGPLLLFANLEFCRAGGRPAGANGRWVLPDLTPGQRPRLRQSWELSRPPTENPPEGDMRGRIAIAIAVPSRPSHGLSAGAVPRLLALGSLPRDRSIGLAFAFENILQHVALAERTKSPCDIVTTVSVWTLESEAACSGLRLACLNASTSCTHLPAWRWWPLANRS